MEPSEEKFFESLARGDAEPAEKPETEQESELEVELAKAATAPTRTRTISRKPADDVDNEPEGQLTIDVYQTSADIVIESAIAGVKPEDLDITVLNDSVAIKGRRHHESEVRDEDYFYQECYWGKFSRSVILPQEIDPETATVSFRNGILTIRLPKLNKKKAKKLKVRID